MMLLTRLELHTEVRYCAHIAPTIESKVVERVCSLKSRRAKRSRPRANSARIDQTSGTKRRDAGLRKSNPDLSRLLNILHELTSQLLNHPWFRAIIIVKRPTHLGYSP